VWVGPSNAAARPLDTTNGKSPFGARKEGPPGGGGEEEKYKQSEWKHTGRQRARSILRAPHSPSWTSRTNATRCLSSALTSVISSE